MSTELEGKPGLSQNSVITYNVTDAALMEHKEKYEQLPDIKTKDGYEHAKLCLRESTAIRTGVEARRKELNSDAVVYKKRVDAKAKEIIADVLSVETPMRELKKEQDEVIEFAKQEKIRIENERVARIEENIQAIKGYAATCINLTSSQIAEKMEKLSCLVLEESVFEERRSEAQLLRLTAIDQVQEVYDSKLKQEREAIRLEEERKKLEVEKERMRLEEEERQKKIAEDNEKARIENEKIRLEQEARQKEIDEKNETIRREQEAAQQAIEADNARIKEEQEAAQRKIDEENQRIADEKKRLADEAEASKKVGASDLAKTMQEAAGKTKKGPAVISDGTAMMREETYQALIDILDENSAGLLIEALVAGSVPHISIDWLK